MRDPFFILLLYALLLHILYLMVEERVKERKQWGSSCHLYYNPALERVCLVSCMVRKKVPCKCTQEAHSWFWEPKACVTRSKDCSFKPLPKHRDNRTEKQERRKQPEKPGRMLLCGEVVLLAFSSWLSSDVYAYSETWAVKWPWMDNYTLLNKTVDFNIYISTSIGKWI